MRVMLRWCLWLWMWLLRCSLVCCRLCIFVLSCMDRLLSGLWKVVFVLFGC